MALCVHLHSVIGIAKKFPRNYDPFNAKKKYQVAGRVTRKFFLWILTALIWESAEVFFSLPPLEPYWKSNIRVILFGITYRCAILGIIAIGVYTRASTSLMNLHKWLVIATSLFLLLKMYTFYFSSNVHKNFHVQNLWLLDISIAKRFLRYPKTISPALSSYASFFNFIYLRWRHQFFLIFG